MSLGTEVLAQAADIGLEPDILKDLPATDSYDILPEQNPGFITGPLGYYDEPDAPKNSALRLVFNELVQEQNRIEREIDYELDEPHQPWGRELFNIMQQRQVMCMDQALRNLVEDGSDPEQAVDLLEAYIDDTQTEKTADYRDELDESFTAMAAADRREIYLRPREMPLLSNKDGIIIDLDAGRFIIPASDELRFHDRKIKLRQEIARAKMCQQRLQLEALSAKAILAVLKESVTSER